MSIWLKNPLAVHASGDAGGGIVIEGTKIVELVPAGSRPATAIDEVFDASGHVLKIGRAHV